MTEETRYARERHQKLSLPSGATAEFWLERLGDKVEMHSGFRTADGGASGGNGGWNRCSQHGCLGEAVSTGGVCIAHAAPSQRTTHLSSLSGSNRPLQLRGIAISQQLWDEIVSSPVFTDGVPQVAISFAGSEINAAIRLDNRRLEHWMDFTGASVFAHVEMRQSQFLEGLVARYAFFNGGALNCSGSTFQGTVDLSYSRTEKVTHGFEGCVFDRDLSADGIEGVIYLNKADIHGAFTCKHATATLIMNSCRVRGTLDLSESELKGLHGESAVFDSANRFGPCKIPYLSLVRSTFGTRTHLDVESERVDLSGANLKGGGLLELGGGKVALDQIILGGPLRVMGKFDLNEPKVLSLLNSDAGQMSFARVDLTLCSFHGAHGLGTVDIDSSVIFLTAPVWAGGRRYIADEYAWRSGAGRIHNFGWLIDGIHVGPQPPKFMRSAPQKVHLKPLGAAQVAVIYRELRRSLESKSDMPGAADFYYGEMEMRRWSRQGPLLDRLLATGYWVLSGYGLRPARALVWWSLAVIVGAFAMGPSGFVEGEWSPERGSLFALRASLPGISTLEKLTPLGQGIETSLRVLGPLLLALFVLALRARVMRKPSE